MQLDLSSTIPVVSFIPYVLFLFFGMYQRKNEALNIPFILYMSFMAVWSFGSFMMHANTGISTPLFWNRIMLIGLLGVPIGIFHTVLSLIGRVRKAHRYLMVTGYFIYFVLQYMNFRGMIVTNAWFEGRDFFYTLSRTAMIAYTLCYLFLICGIFILINELVYTKNDQLKRKLRIPLIGTIGLITGVLVNLYEPLGRYPIDLFSAMVNAFCIFYAIYRYKLIHYSAMVLQVLLYIILITVSVFAFVGIIWMTFSSVRNIPLQYSILPSLLLGVVAAIIFQPMRLGTQNILEKLVFGKHPSYYGTMNSFLESISSVVDVEILASSTVTRLREMFGPTWACMIITDFTTRAFRIAEAGGIDFGGKDVEIITFNGNSPLQLDLPQYTDIIYQPEDTETVEVLVGGKKTVLNPGLILFLRFNKRLNGFILLSKRKDRDYYDQHDMEVLDLLAHQCSITLENAISFERLKRQQKKLQNLNQDLVLSRNMLQAYFDGITTPISIQDVNYNIVSVNVAASHYFKKPLKDLLGLKCYNAFFHRTKPCDGCMAQDCCHAQIPFSSELSDPNSDKVFETEFYPISVSLRQDTLFLEFFKDITQQKKLQAELQQSEKLAAIGTLASGIANEINNPLFSIIGTAQTMLENAMHDLNVHELTQDILKNARAAAEVVQNLATYSDYEHRETRHLDIAEILVSTLKLAMNGMDFKNITIRKDLEQIPEIEVKAGELQQVILNIIINAVHSMPNGGDLHLSCGRKNSIIFIRIASEGYQPETGGLGGIAAAAYSNQLREKGAQFDLSICQQIIIRMAGRIDVEKKPGSGSEVIISLPLTAEDRERIRYVHAKTPQEINDVFFLQRKILVGEKGYIEETIRKTDDRDTYHLLAYKGLQPVGTATCAIRQPGSGTLPIEESFRLDRFKGDRICAEIERLAVLKEERNSLIPLGLMVMAYVYLRSCGATRVFLDVFSDEKKLIRMYNKLGFTYIGEYVSPLPVTVMYVDGKTDYEKKSGRMEGFVKPFMSRLSSKLDLTEDEMYRYREGMRLIVGSAGDAGDREPVEESAEEAAVAE